ncbi:MAG: serine protease [Pseudomonadota bacterium]
MVHRFWLILVAILALSPAHLAASEADIDASARGVVRVITYTITPNRRFVPLGHGTGFAVAEDKFVTNAHVIERAARYNDVYVGIIPPKGDKPTPVKLVTFSRNRDLAVLEAPESLRLPPLTFVSNFTSENSDVVAVGFPGAIDDTLGMGREPTVTRGIVSQQRVSRDVRIVMHSASIARGNSGGPLLDECGRIVGVNTFSANSTAAEGEFFFSVANAETLAFLRNNDVSPKVSDLPCRSLAELEQEEKERNEIEQKKIEEEQRVAQETENQERARIERQITEERENMMALAAILLVVAAGGGALSYQASQSEGGKNRAIIFGAIGGIAAIGAVYSWVTRPSADDVEDRLLAASGDNWSDEEGISGLQPGMFACTLDTERSRVTSAPPRDVEFEWRAEGCRGESQYQSVEGVWRRVFVPQEDYMVRVATIDLAKGEFRNERYLLPKTEWQKARDARMSYSPPSCGAPNASQRLSDMQEGVLAMLPDQPNERLVYKCESK